MMPEPSDTVRPAAGSGTEPQQTPSPEPHLYCHPLLGAMVGLVACLLTWAILEWLLPVFILSPELRTLPVPLPVETVEKLDRELGKIAIQNAIVAMAVVGLVLGGSLAAAEALARRRWHTGLRMAAVGGLIAGLCAAGAGLVGAVAFQMLANLPGWSPLAKTVISQTVLLGLFGLGLGVAIGLLFVNSRLLLDLALGGLLGGALAALLYPAGISFLLPLTQTERIIPEAGLSRFLWLAAVGVLTSLVVTALGRKPGTTSAGTRT